jgi:hypothetical protein
MGCHLVNPELIVNTSLLIKEKVTEGKMEHPNRGGLIIVGDS